MILLLKRKSMSLLIVLLQVESGPPALQKPANNSEYTLTSIMATARILLGIPTTPLTKRDEWSATFEHLFETLDSPRTDCPLHLPDAPPPSQTFEETLPVNSLQRNIMGMHAHLTGINNTLVLDEK